MRYPGQLLVALLAGAVGIAAGPWVVPASAQEAVFVVRHAERLDDSGDSPLSA